MALTEAIAAQTAAATSTAITLTGPTEFKADDLPLVQAISRYRYFSVGCSNKNQH